MAAAGLKTIGPALRNAILVLVYFEFWQIRNQLVQKKNTAFIQYNAASTICYKSFATTGIFRHFRKYNEFQSTANSGAIYRLEYKKFHEGCAKEHL